MSDHVKLFIPGPIEVTDETYAAMSAPMIGHRSKDFQALYADVQPHLRTAFATDYLALTAGFAFRPRPWLAFPIWAIFPPIENAARLRS